MKIFFALVLLLVASSIQAQPGDGVSLTLPEWDWIVPLTSPTLFEREGVVAAEENPFWRELWPLMQQERYDDALTLFRQNYVILNDMEAGIVHTPITHTPSMSTALMYLLGSTYRMLEQNDAAETTFLSALAYLPDYIRVHESLGLLYINEERFDEAYEHITRAVELGLNSATLNSALGYLNMVMDNPWGAVSAYQNAMMLAGDNEQHQRGLLNALTQSRNYGSALALVEELLERNESDADLWVFRAYLSRQTDDEAGALASLETAIRLGDASQSNLQVCATLHMQIGSVERATELLQRGIAAGMTYLFIDQAIAWLIQQQEWDLATDLIATAQADLAVIDDSQRSSLASYAATIAFNNDDVERARRGFDEALELDASNAEALMQLAGLYQFERNFGQAELYYQRASAFTENRERALLAMAQIAIDQGQYERALDLLRDIVATNPLRVDLRRNMEILENLVQLRGGV